ncbi:MAG: class I SAM-dependent methyltransferase [Cyanobacteria bacterium J06597_16]
MSTQQGSYWYDNFQEETQVQELERLYRQASTLLETERQMWPGLGILPGRSVLDLGCGSGVITNELAKEVYPAQVTGIDVSQDLLRKSQLDCLANAKKERNISFQEGNVYDLPFRDGVFDVVYARLIFQHLNKPLDALKNIWRVIKPGGLLCIVDVDRDWSSLYPEPQTSVNLDQAVIERQIEQGGDPWVGRKLGHYLSSSRFVGIKTNVTLVDSDQLGLANFFNMLSFGSTYNSEQNQLVKLQEEVRPDVQALLDSPYAWAGFGLFVVTGRKE